MRNKRIGLIMVFAVIAIIWKAGPVIGGAGTDGTPPVQPDSQKVGTDEPAGAGVNQLQMQTGGPQIYLPETSFDFGPVSQGSTLVHNFVVQNTGDAPLKLIRAKGS